MDSVYGDKTLKRTQIYDILKKVKEGKNTDDQRHKNPKKTVRTAAMIASVAAAIEEDRRRDIRSLASAHGTTVWTISTILHQDLGLVKKSARWVPKLLSDAQKQERVRVCSEFVAAVKRRSKAMLDNIVTMDETSYTRNKKPVKAVGQKGKTRPPEGAGPCQSNQTDDLGFL